MSKDDDDRRKALVPVAVFAKLDVPHCEADHAERTELIETLAEMQILQANMVQLIPGPLPIIRVAYAETLEPQTWWARWLIAQVETRGRKAWLARLAGIVTETREIYLHPLPDQLEYAIASKALLQQDRVIASVSLGVSGQPHFSTVRYFFH